MKREGRVRKSRVIHLLEIGFTLLNKKNRLIILAMPTGCATEGIGKSIVPTTLSISICKAKNLYINVSRI